MNLDNNLAAAHLNVPLRDVSRVLNANSMNSEWGVPASYARVSRSLASLSNDDGATNFEQN